MSARVRWIVVSIVAAGVLVAVLIPNGRFCYEGDRFRQWSYTNEEWSHGCYPNAIHPMGAEVDNRVALRIGVALAAAVFAWSVVAFLRRRSASGAKLDAPDWVVVASFGTVGAVLAFVLSIREESKCILAAPGSLMCEYKSILGWDTEPLVVDALWVTVGLTVGIASGLVIARVTGEEMRGRPVEGAVKG